MIFNYTSVERQNKAALAGHGAGGMAEVKAQLSPTAIQFFGFRITGSDARSKFCKVFYQSQTASPMQKGKAARDKGPIFSAMSSTHVEMNLDEVDDLSEDAVLKLLKQCSGFQPESYVFN